LTENNLIGSGGSGKVYRIAINRAGDFVAVKRIWSNEEMDHKLEKEFLAEVQILGTIRHANIVKLMCCISSEKSKLLVYEYMENHSLDRWLHGKKRSSSMGASSVRHSVLDWPTRFQIAIGAARGLCYMHHDCSTPIVHRDVKSSNILLDSEFKARIADFGLAKMLAKQGEAHTMSAVAGSFGYIAPGKSIRQPHSALSRIDCSFYSRRILRSHHLKLLVSHFYHFYRRVRLYNKSERKNRCV
jgi:serine/threonine protein kinase